MTTGLRTARREGLRYRSIGSIGYIIPPRCNETVLEEAIALRPEGVAWCFATLGLANLDASLYEESLRQVDAAVEELIAREVDVIVYGGMPLTAAQGADFAAGSFDKHLQELVAGRLPIATDTSVVLQALDQVGVRRCAVVTPYRQQTLDQVCEMLTAGGITVNASVGLGHTLPEFITTLEADSAFDAAMALYEENPDIDGFYLSCPQWPLVDNIERIEQATGKPVVTQVQAIMWWARMVRDWDVDIAGFGRLVSGT